MSSTHTTLDAASTDRKARLAKLASLKRKQPGSDTTDPSRALAEDPEQQEQKKAASSQTDIYLSGRNYDITTKGPRLGFESLPSNKLQTVETQAAQLSLDTSEQASRDEVETDRNGIDLFKLQPKKPNWDLKRDLTERTRILDVRTKNAIARLVRERIQKAKNEATAAAGQKHPGNNGDDEDEGEEVGLDGNTLVEGVHLREREEEEEERRERELDKEEVAIA